MQRDDLPDPGLPPGFDRWLEVGPVRAPDGLLEASMRPLPRLRRRGAWRIRLARLTPRPPAVALAGVVIVLAVVGGLATGFPNVGPGAQPSLAPDRGGFALELSGARSGRWLSDPRAALLTCVTPDAGPWVFQYAGGDPFVSIDVVVPDGATTEPGSERVAAEIEFADGPYVRFDPAGIRGGDPEGRSTASVVVRTTGTAASFTVDATTPDRTLGVDGAPVVVLLTVYCPR